MKKLTSLFALAFSITFLSYGQISNYNDIITGKKVITDVYGIKTLNDFDQTKLSAAEIDVKIANIIKNSKSTENYDLEFPINSKKLTYVGKKHPKDALKFSKEAFQPGGFDYINMKFEIFTYDDIYIFLPTKSGKDLLTLFFTARAIDVMKNVYPNVYNRIIKQQQTINAASYISRDPFRKIPAFNKCTSVISYDLSPVYVAASAISVAEADSARLTIDGYSYYENDMNLILSIDNETIAGSTKYGSRKLYALENPNDNYFHYMRDGLIETIMHEYLHLYIQSYSNIDKKANFIYEMRYDTIDKSFSYDVEEAVVVNTISRYYKKLGGVSSTVVNYYAGKLNQKKAILTSYYTNKINLQRYYALKALSKNEADSFEDVYYLDILED